MKLNLIKGGSNNSNKIRVTSGYQKAIDIFFNVISPVSLGYMLYFLSNENMASRTIRNHLPDGLWAYAFQSCILIIWNRKGNIMWTLFIMTLSLGFEVLQHIHFIDGTGDYIDIITYFVFFGIALIVNRFLILHTHYLTKKL
ncbi:MAG TPA: hypothetical protein VF622_03765 [Segetibacter sp.]